MARNGTGHRLATLPLFDLVPPQPLPYLAASDLDVPIELIKGFGGPGGWDAGLALLDPRLHARSVGIEIDPTACTTRRDAGHRTIEADIRALDPLQIAKATTGGQVRGGIFSPPCQTFSASGKGTGRDSIDSVLATVACLAKRCGCRYSSLSDQVADERTALVVEPLRWVNALEDHGLEWLALEQVPAVEPVWHAIGDVLDQRGWKSIWVGQVDAADYGVPQHRRRAILLAHRDKTVTCPLPTHGDTLGADPYRTPLSVLGLDGTLGFARRNDRNDGLPYRARDMRPTNRTAFTVTEKVRSWTFVPADGSAPRKLTIDEAAQLQSFPAGYPWAGSRTAAALQIANAVPPLMAAHLLNAVINAEAEKPVPAIPPIWFPNGLPQAA